MNSRNTTFAVLVIASLFALGCSLVTDFDESLLDDAGVDGSLYSLQDNIGGSVLVTLVGEIGIIEIELTNPLPTGDDGAFRDLLASGTIWLTVENTDSGVNYALVNGNAVDSQPSAEGDYNVEINPARTTVSIQFFNHFDGRTIRADGSYTAAIDVQDQDDNEWFVVETFTVGVEVEQN